MTKRAFPLLLIAVVSQLVARHGRRGGFDRHGRDLKLVKGTGRVVSSPKGGCAGCWTRAEVQQGDLPLPQTLQPGVFRSS